MNRVATAIVVGLVLVAASIVFVGRWQIAAIGYAQGASEEATTTEAVYRLDRWTGEIVECRVSGDSQKRFLREGIEQLSCRFPQVIQH